MKLMVPRWIIGVVAAFSVTGWQTSSRVEPTLSIARLHYEGGGDWYANPSSLPNLLRAIGERTKLRVSDR